jgi:hypothetical protein
MKTYLTLKSIPELSNQPPAERGRLWRKHAWKSFHSKQTWIGIGIYVLVVAIGFYFSLHVKPWFPHRFGILSVAFGFGYWIFLQFMIPTIRKHLRKEMEIINLSGE